LTFFEQFKTFSIIFSLYSKNVNTIYFLYYIYNFRQQEAEGELNIVLTELRAKQQMLADVQARLKKLEDTYDESVSEKNKLELNISKTQSRLNRSDLLVEALSDEQLRWENNIQVLILLHSLHYLMHFNSNLTFTI